MAVPSPAPVDNGLHVPTIDRHGPGIETEVCHAPRAKTCVGEDPSHQEQQILDEVRELQDYMTSLLARLGTTSATVVAAASLPVPADGKRKSSAIAPERTPKAHPHGGNADQASGAATVPRELARRPLPPETGSLVAMREIANAHTRAAIGTHTLNVLIKRTLDYGSAGLGCLVAAVVVLTCVPDLGRTMQVGQMTVVIASAYFLYVAFVSAKKLLRFRPAPTDEADIETAPVRASSTTAAVNPGSTAQEGCERSSPTH